MGKAGVLLVDGNRDVLKSNAAALADNPIRAVVTETVLPDGSGLDFCMELRNPSSALCPMNSALIPVLFLSALSGREDELRGYAAGCNGYVTKPYSVDVLVARVGAALR